jgi:hypothetical protein
MVRRQPACGLETVEACRAGLIWSRSDWPYRFPSRFAFAFTRRAAGARPAWNIALAVLRGVDLMVWPKASSAKRDHLMLRRTKLIQVNLYIANLQILAIHRIVIGINFISLCKTGDIALDEIPYCIKIVAKITFGILEATRASVNRKIYYF